MKKTLFILIGSLFIDAITFCICYATDLCLEHTNKGEYGKAIIKCTEYIDNNIKGKELAGHYYARGYSYSQKGDNDKSIADYTKAIELGGIHSEVLKFVYNSRGEAFRHNGDYDKAIADYNRALDLNPKFQVSYNNRGIAYRLKGIYDKAMLDFNKAIELNPNDARPYNNRGGLFFIKMLYDKAMSDYNKAIELNQENYIPYFNRGNTYYVMGDFDKALIDYKKALELNPDYERSYLKVIFASRKVSSDKYEEALNNLKDYISSNNSNDLIRLISKFYLKKDRVNENDIIMKASDGEDDKKVRENLCEIYYYLGEERLWQGDHKGAMNFFKKSLETNIFDHVEYSHSKAMLALIEKGKL